MPLVRREPATPSIPDTAAPSLGAPEPEIRRQAAHALAADPGAAEALGRAYGTERDPTVREAILTSLVRIGGPGAVEAIIPYLGADEAALRTGAVDALRSLPDTLDRLPMLLEHPDPDLRILAAEIARSMPAASGATLLCRHLAVEHDPNVCATALDVLAEIGGPDCLPTLRACADRFAAEPFLRYAVGVAMARIAGPQATGAQ